ncbi:WYL domain-containing protein [Streptomyces sp. SID161]|uniref:WYL domain-containing protein n=1 Tax=Streptomyces sp. SID161 TaxID=2690251 RepID=UPI0013719603|nr:WYL domain-containing protein [Streptomyces sp. SID161]MYW49616.1 WYL domain-containing protein [Streptomyces sp. SID161]
MRLTAKQTQTKTLTDLYRSIDRRQAVTLTYLDEKGEETVRTVEPFELRTGKGGVIELHAMCRLRGEARRFFLHRVTAYTTHRMAFVLERPANTTYEPTPAAPADDEMALIFFELERDPDDADHRPRRKLTAADTDLAA